MSTEFAIAEVMPGKLNALVKNIMSQTGEADPNEAVRLVNSGEWVVSKPTRSWREEDDVIYFSVTSDGTTGKEWIKRLEKKGVSIGDYTKRRLRSKDFRPTNSVTTEVAVLKSMLFADIMRTTGEICSEADKRKLREPNAEMACLICEKFTNEEIKAMGLVRIVTMHGSIKDSEGDSVLLHIDCTNTDRALRACITRSGITFWDRRSGFAFAVAE